MKNVYFLSDAHLGSLAIEHGRTKERKLANFLDSIKHRAQAVYLMGDLFDFWHEYRYVVPKGYTRLLGKISELTDAGVEVHYFCGNHDLWQHDYFERECGMVLHRHNEVVEIGDKTFFLGHGDGLNRQERGFKLLRALFHNRLCQTLFAAVHPRWGMAFGLEWAKHSRLKREDGKEPPYQGEDKETSSSLPKTILKRIPTSTSSSLATATSNSTSCSPARHAYSFSAIGFRSTAMPCSTVNTCIWKTSSRAKPVRNAP